jgi:hypothetical protein
MITVLGISLFLGYILGVVLLATHFSAKQTNTASVPEQPQAARNDFVVWYYTSVTDAQTRRKRIIDKFELDPNKVVVKRRWLKSREGKIVDAYAVVITDPAYTWS